MQPGVMGQIDQLLATPVVERLVRVLRDCRVDAWLVGGAVRDLVRGAAAPDDIDIVLVGDLDAVTDAVRRELGGAVIPWDRDQRRLVLPRRHALHHLDIGRCAGTTIEQDLHRRDFTCNAMAIDLIGAAGLIDPLDGRAAIARRCLCACSPQAFADDPVRVLRCVRLSQTLDFSIDGATARLAAATVRDLPRCACERIKNEFCTALGSASLGVLHAWGVLALLIPETAQWPDLPRNQHHPDDLLTHALETVRAVERLCDEPFAHGLEFLDEEIEQAVSRRSLLVLAALLHDSGKVSTCRSAAGTVTFHGHETAGAVLNRRIAARLGLGRRAQRMLAGITAMHMRPGQLARLGQVTERACVRLVRDAGEVAGEVILLGVADARAKRAADCQHHEQLARRLLTLRAGRPASVELVTGADVMTCFNVGPSALVGRVLAEIHALEAQGALSTREDALQWMQRNKARFSE